MYKGALKRDPKLLELQKNIGNILKFYKQIFHMKEQSKSLFQTNVKIIVISFL